jgi:hypothetical protein
MCFKNTPQDVWKRIDIGNEDECWNWRGVIGKGGYGHMRINYKQYKLGRS